MDMSLGPRFFKTFGAQVTAYPTTKWLGFNWMLAACHYSEWMSLILHVQPPAGYDGQYFVDVKMWVEFLLIKIISVPNMAEILGRNEFNQKRII